jgi:hypothetical protein
MDLKARRRSSIAIRARDHDLRTLKQKLDDATDAIEDDMFAVDEAKRSLQEHGDSLKDDM